MQLEKRIQGESCTERGNIDNFVVVCWSTRRRINVGQSSIAR